MPTTRSFWLVLAVLAAQACFFKPTGSQSLAADGSSTGSSSSGDLSTGDLSGEASGWPPACGDGLCSLEEFQGGVPSCVEDCMACLPPEDGQCYFEGDEICEGDKGENVDNSLDCHDPACGDGVAGAGEECDDGNLDDTDQCTSACEQATCGDGILWVGVEACDDANQDDSDACTSACMFAVCGDGYVQFGVEACDDANEIATDACVDCMNAICGDGIAEGVEECDDGNGNDFDECGVDCQRVAHRRVFVTSKVFDGDLGGMQGADQACVEAALSAGLGNGKEFKAWLSDFSTSPADRFHKEFTGVYSLVDGAMVAKHGWLDLVDGELEHPIDRDENMAVVSGFVWSNTRADGLIRSQFDHCDNWTSAFAELGGAGRSDSPQGDWTNYKWLDCNYEARLYCFEDHS